MLKSIKISLIGLAIYTTANVMASEEPEAKGDILFSVRNDTTQAIPLTLSADWMPKKRQTEELFSLKKVIAPHTTSFFEKRECESFIKAMNLDEIRKLGKGTFFASLDTDGQSLMIATYNFDKNFGKWSRCNRTGDIPYGRTYILEPITYKGQDGQLVEDFDIKLQP